MPWNEADREKYAVIRERYASDLSDEEFALILPLLPPPSRRGRKRADPRIVLDALFYSVRAGCPWRYLPKDFPPFTTVQNQFYAWRDSGLWTQILCVLVMEARESDYRMHTSLLPLGDLRDSRWGTGIGAGGRGWKWRMRSWSGIRWAASATLA